ncbi:MAG TPA: TerC/Alx family metal homeostasis membrane protein [Solirubrobacteraceae bacterium]|nr:TerC/Alx family metal homeostasis membrane protein [Solirubrobacteraceae bacterium]
MLHVSAAGWAATLVALAALFGFDLVRSARRPHAVGFREAAVWSVLYIAVALLFGVVFGLVAGWDLGAQYFAGYIVEKSLSVDNLFVFLIIMTTFSVPAEQQARALTIGIVAALVMRAIFIAAGAALLDAFSIMFLVFGLALALTAVQLFRHRNEDPSVDDNVLVSAARRLLPITTEYHGPSIVVRTQNRRVLTPLFLVLIAIGSTDLLFALDSIPAVFGVTQHAYIVFVANAFALLGLRALFFLVSGLLDRLVYLSGALALILGFIGVKLILHYFHLHNSSVPEISTGLSLGVIVVVLAVATAASVIKARRDPAARAHAGRLRERRSDRDGRANSPPG